MHPTPGGGKAEKMIKAEQDWKKQLTPQQYYVCREKGTEPAFTGEYWNCHENGMCLCACCDSPLFDSSAKFDAGTRMAFIFATDQPGEYRFRARQQLWHAAHRGFARAVCDAHLGHVFEDALSPRFALLHQLRFTQARAGTRKKVRPEK